jgi:hypothetical protein
LSADAAQFNEREFEGLMLAVVRGVINEHIPPDLAADFFKQIYVIASNGIVIAEYSESAAVFAPSRADPCFIPSILADIFWQMDIELIYDNMDPPATTEKISKQRSLLVKLARATVVSSNI